MRKITSLKNKREEMLKNKSASERALAAAYLAKEEMRRNRDVKEPINLASGKSDESGNMIIEDLTPIKEN